MDFESNYDIALTADYIRSQNFSKVALQFPDHLLKDAPRVSKSLKTFLGKRVRLFVMADTAYGSCCVDEVGASHVDADCVVHYGHACMSPTSKLPALFVYGKDEIDVDDCAVALGNCASAKAKLVLVLFGLDYAHALDSIKFAVHDRVQLNSSSASIHYAEAASSIMNPSVDKSGKEQLQSNGSVSSSEESGDIKMVHDSNQCTDMDFNTRYSIGGLSWNIPAGQKMEDCLLFWIGADDPAFANVVLTFNTCSIVRYDAKERKLLDDFPPQTRILKRRYYLVEKAKDANIVGILVGTLGVAGYLHMVNQMKELIYKAGKKSYTLVMGRPNSAKLANFPECDVFVFVSCAQTALLDSKDFLAPVITPFEAVLAFSRGRQWTGEYVMDFRELINSAVPEDINGAEEARFSFLQGGYMEDISPQENGKGQKESSLDLVEATEKALSLKNQSVDSILFKGTATNGAEFFAARSYQGLNGEYENPSVSSYVIGRAGRAAGYSFESNEHAKD